MWYGGGWWVVRQTVLVGVPLYTLCSAQRIFIGEGTEASQRPLGIGTNFAHGVSLSCHLDTSCSLSCFFLLQHSSMVSSFCSPSLVHLTSLPPSFCTPNPHYFSVQILAPVKASWTFPSLPTACLPISPESSFFLLASCFFLSLSSYFCFVHLYVILSDMPKNLKWLFKALCTMIPNTWSWTGSFFFL